MVLLMDMEVEQVLGKKTKMTHVLDRLDLKFLEEPKWNVANTAVCVSVKYKKNLARG